MQGCELRCRTYWPDLSHLVPPVCRHFAYCMFQVGTSWKMCLRLLWLVRQRKRVFCRWLTNTSQGTLGLCNHV
jgi:hypothetical protein